MRNYILVLLTVVCLGLAGCASPHMKSVDPMTMNTAISQEEAAIVFFRAETFAFAVQAPVLEVKDNGELEFIAIISAGAKFFHKTTPGKHLYLIDGEFGYFLDATLEGGKTYYSYVVPKTGWWGARFLFSPVTAEAILSDTFKKDLAWCDWRENTPEGHLWFAKERGRLQGRYANLIVRYEQFKPEDKTTMLPEFGTTIPAL